LLEGAGKSADDGGKAAPKESEAKPAAKEGEAKKEPSETKAESIDTSGIKAEIVLMPKMSDTMDEGVIAAWHKKVGDSVKSGELLAEVETDKATMEYESYNTGTLLHIGADAGQAVPVDGVLAIIGEKDADWETLLKAHKSKATAGKSDDGKKEEAPVKA